jgi:hypothetical protein
MDRILNIDDLFAILKLFSCQTRQYFFRGQSNDQFLLLPAIGRYSRAELDVKFDKATEERMLGSFSQKGYAYLNPQSSTIELMAIAQHHGLPTRLLDWTYNPLVAIYFASLNDETDGALFYAEIAKVDYYYHTPSVDPFSIASWALYEPKYINPRIGQQSGLFSIHGEPNKPLEDKVITKVTIAKDAKEHILQTIESLGIHGATLFPGLDGIAAHIKWLYVY